MKLSCHNHLSFRGPEYNQIHTDTTVQNILTIQGCNIEYRKQQAEYSQLFWVLCIYGRISVKLTPLIKFYIFTLNSFYSFKTQKKDR